MVPIPGEPAPEGGVRGRFCSGVRVATKQPHRWGCVGRPNARRHRGESLDQMIEGVVVPEGHRGVSQEVSEGRMAGRRRPSLRHGQLELGGDRMDPPVTMGKPCETCGCSVLRFGRPVVDDRRQQGRLFKSRNRPTSGGGALLLEHLPQRIHPLGQDRPAPNGICLAQDDQRAPSVDRRVGRWIRGRQQKERVFSQDGGRAQTDTQDRACNQQSQRTGRASGAGEGAGEGLVHHVNDVATPRVVAPRARRESVVHADHRTSLFQTPGAAMIRSRSCQALPMQSPVGFA